MIDKNVVLVLGAGASHPYGFPLGGKLVTNLTKLSHRFPQRFKDWGFASNKISSFQRALRRAKVKSIDSFLESRSEFINLGKILIAIELMRKEDEDLLYPAKDDWVVELFDFMSTPTLDEFRQNKLSVVTYNYDRSFDLMLYNYLKEKYPASEEQVLEILEEIQIIHLHGKLGDLPHVRNGGSQREYSSVIEREEINVASSGIRVIHEDMDVETDPEYQRAHEAIRQAESVVFMGFGYHQINVDRLRLPDNCMRLVGTPLVKLAGTAYGLTPDEMDRVKRQFRQPAVSGMFGLDLQPCTCTDFLRNNYNLFMKAQNYPVYPQVEIVEKAPAEASVED